MMEPIISPWLVYFIGVTASIKTTVLVATILLGAAAFISTMVAAGESYWGEWWPNIKKVILGFVLSGALFAMTPSRDTIILMIVADHITPDNVKTAGGTLEDVRAAVKSDVIEIIGAVQGDD